MVKPKFDMTINVGHVLTFVIILFMANSNRMQKKKLRSEINDLRVIVNRINKAELSRLKLRQEVYANDLNVMKHLLREKRHMINKTRNLEIVNKELSFSQFYLMKELIQALRLDTLRKDSTDHPLFLLLKICDIDHKLMILKEDVELAKERHDTKFVGLTRFGILDFDLLYPNWNGIDSSRFLAVVDSTYYYQETLLINQRLNLLDSLAKYGYTKHYN